MPQIYQFQVLSCYSLIFRQFQLIGFFHIGMFRLVDYLSQDHLLGKKRAFNFVVDSGTGTTAVGLGLGAMCLGCVLFLSYIFLVKSNILQ